MKVICRLFCLLLACALTIGILAACRRIEEPVETETEAVTVTAESECEVAETSEDVYDGYTLNGTPIGEYAVIFAQSSGVGGKGLAQSLVDAIKEKTGETLRLLNDNSEEDGRKEIVVGNTKRTLPSVSPSYQNGDGYVLAASEGRVFVFGANTVCTVKAIQAFEDLLFSLKEGERELSIETKSYADPDTSLVAMSFNVWVNAASWQQRAPSVLSVINSACPDTFGVQEADGKWMTYLSEHLPDYAYVGEGRNGGTSGEYSAVFYRTDVFTLLESDTKWLSDTPDVVSKYEESSYRRIFTYALLERKSDGKKIMHVNTHLDHTSAEARKKQTAVLVSFLNQHKDVPVLVSGDFNATLFATDIAGMLNAGFETSAKVALSSDGMAATFSTKVIDYIFVREKTVKVYEYRVDRSKPNGIQPSDHNPIYIRYDLA